MSEHMKRHLTNNHPLVIILTHGDNRYAFPAQLAEKYRIPNDINIDEDYAPADEYFSTLESHYTPQGAILRGLRLSEGLIQNEFAKRINITQAELSKMETGKRPISKALAKRIERVFDIDYRLLL